MVTENQKPEQTAGDYVIFSVRIHRTDLAAVDAYAERTGNRSRASVIREFLINGLISANAQEL